jgi:hypothetical protein
MSMVLGLETTEGRQDPRQTRQNHARPAQGHDPWVREQSERERAGEATRRLTRHRFDDR